MDADEVQRGSILVVIGSLDVGGAERHLVQVLPLLAKRGYQIAVFCLSHRGEMASQLEHDGVSVQAIDDSIEPRHRASLATRIWQLIRSSLALRMLIRIRQPNVVHFFLPAAYVVGAICALAAGHRCLVMSRRSLNEYQRRHSVAAIIERWLHGRMRILLGNSEAVLRQLAEEGAPVERLRLIYNGIDVSPVTVTPEVRAESRRSMGIDRNTFVIIMVANLISYKGHEDLLHAIAMIKDKLPPDWLLLCVGRDDGLLVHLERLARKLGIEKSVLWLGGRRDIAELLAASDLGILCSHQEGFSNAVLEYMAASLPVVVTDVGGNKEAVIDGETGWVVPPHSPVALAEAIEQASRVESDRRAMGQAARRRVKERFDLSRTITAYADMYASIIASS